MNTTETGLRVKKYIQMWQDRCYSDGIPEEVPLEVSRRNLAPSYKAIAIALLKNDMQLTELGFQSPRSEWYGVLKRKELGIPEYKQLMLF